MTLSKIEFDAEQEVIDFIQTERRRQSLTYINIAHKSGVKLSSLRRVMSKKSRQAILLKEVNAIYHALGYVFVPLAIKQSLHHGLAIRRVNVDYDCC